MTREEFKRLSGLELDDQQWAEVEQVWVSTSTGMSKEKFALAMIELSKGGKELKSVMWDLSEMVTHWRDTVEEWRRHVEANDKKWRERVEELAGLLAESEERATRAEEQAMELRSGMKRVSREVVKSLNGLVAVQSALEEMVERCKCVEL